ncbi:MAG: bifunctional folylpolyglutamate synthase/dihydrofolate synthase [Clostridiales bacterium]|jgi:dihydrofolate synthase/folylpolyglutamate synthase|nr:bifunctional folylpolyglutamate synthase/dihydrofolate synthase [Clostridiales bacterium]
MKSTQYNEALAIITGGYRRGGKGGFGRCSRILARLGNPHKKLKVIHVAGTNGKGSACAFLRGILTESGYSVGMFTSPHLCRYNERYNINGADITDTELAGLVERVSRYAGETPGISYFELLTIMAFVYFYEKKADIAIMEAGIGGRTDATNIVPAPVLSVITSLGMDHTVSLGETLSAITREKAGIIKKNCPAVLYYQPGEVYNVVEAVCRERNAVLYCPDDGFDISVRENGIDGIEFEAPFRLNGRAVGFGPLKTRLSGAYQITNAANIQTAVYALRDAGYNITDAAVKRGLENAAWPGRMEIAGRSPLIILDGAHNPDGARLAVASVKAYFNNKHIILVAGILKEKDYQQIINILAEAADSVILTQPAYSPKAVPAEDLYAALAETHRPKCAGIIADHRGAMDAALRLAGRDGVIFVSGSLYLVGDVRRYLGKD